MGTRARMVVPWPGRAFDFDLAAEAFHAFAHALQAEVALVDARGVAGVEARAIVVDAQFHGSRVEVERDVDISAVARV